MTGFNSKRDMANDKDALFQKFELPQLGRREWAGLTEEDFAAINQSCLTKLQAATSAESILKERNS